jgi:hypothetical protein
MQWKFFLGACFLTAALVEPHAGMMPVIGGIALAGLIRLAWSRINGR